MKYQQIYEPETLATGKAQTSNIPTQAQIDPGTALTDEQVHNSANLVALLASLGGSLPAEGAITGRLATGEAANSSLVGQAIGKTYQGTKGLVNKIIPKGNLGTLLKLAAIEQAASRLPGMGKAILKHLAGD